MPYFGQEIFLRAEAKGRLPRPTTSRRSAATSRRRAIDGIDAVMIKHRLDALVAPTSGPASLTDLVNGDYGTGGAPASRPSQDTRTSPCLRGSCSGCRSGVSIFGRAWSEPTLIRYRVRLRAGHEAPEAAAIPGHG